MRKAKGLAGLVAVMGFLCMLPAPATADSITIDEIICQTCSPNLAGTAVFSLAGSTLTIVLTNTSTGASGGLAATNLLAGIGFNLPTGVTIANNGATNAVALTDGTDINIGGVLSDATWGAGNGALSAINDLTLLGDVNASASTLSAQIDFKLDGDVPPPSIDGPDFGLLSNVLAPGTCGAGLQCEQDSLTLTLVLAGATAEQLAGLLAFIEANHVVLSFGSPTGSTVPEPSTLLLAGTALLGLGYSLRNRLFRRTKEPLAAA